MAIRNLARDWDEYAKIYELKQSSDADLNLNVILPALIDLVPKRLTDLCVLDHCCGRGALTKILLERGAEVTAVDFSKELIRQAKKDIGDHPNVTFAVLDVCKLCGSFSDSFEFIVSNMALQDVHDLQAAINSMNHLAGSDTEIIVSFRHPHTDGWEGNYFAEQTIVNEIQEKWRSGADAQFYPPRYHRPLTMYISCFVNAGFALLDCLEVADCMNRPVAVIIRTRATAN